MPSLKLNIRRFDISGNPVIEKTVIQVDLNTDAEEIKQNILAACNLRSSENKIIKLRNSQQMMIPYSLMMQNIEETYFVDITNVRQVLDTGNNSFQDAYINSLYTKLNIMENRIHQVENLLPQIEEKRHSHLEETVSHLSNKVQFLNRRFDEILSV